jgi:hypothetical protein
LSTNNTNGHERNGAASNAEFVLFVLFVDKPYCLAAARLPEIIPRFAGKGDLATRFTR